MPDIFIVSAACSSPLKGFGPLHSTDGLLFFGGGRLQTVSISCNSCRIVQVDCWKIRFFLSLKDLNTAYTVNLLKAFLQVEVGLVLDAGSQ